MRVLNSSAASLTSSSLAQDSSQSSVECGARQDWKVIAALSALLSALAFAWYFLHHEVLLYGDAVAHLNIARRVFDSRNPGLLQLGTVWLPLPHVLTIPFVYNDWMWRTGFGASLASMLAYVIGTVGVFRLVRGRASRPAAWVAAGIYALNPSLLYMQSTAMTEAMFLAAMVWAVAYLDELLRGLSSQPSNGLPAQLAPWTALERCGIALATAIFTRYDGWILAFIVGIVATIAVVRALRFRHIEAPARMSRALCEFLLLCALCPTLWLAHNYAISQHPLDWLNGPYSAKAIEKRSTRPGDPPYPGKGHMFVAAEYFLKCARMNIAEGVTEKPVFALALAGTALAMLRFRRYGVWLLLWIPLPFYAYSIAYGSVPIFLPVWWPFSYYNVRYGLELVPMFAVFIGLLTGKLSELKTRQANAFLVLCGVVLGAAYVSSWRGDSFMARGVRAPKPGPICLREAMVNGQARMTLESRLADVIRCLPAHSQLMMGTGTHVGALQMAGVPLSRTVNESTFIVWDAAQSSPAAVGDYVVAFDGDAVARSVKANPRGLELLQRIEQPEQPGVNIYRSKWRER